MKYAILGPQKGINRISDKEPNDVPKIATVVEISDDIAATVIAGRASNPPVRYFLIEGELKTISEKIAIEQGMRQAERAVNMTIEQKIQAGEMHVANAGLSAARLVTLMDLLLQTKEANALASKPKLVALYAWLQTVKGMAIAGNISFPSAPYTFEEVVSE